MVFRLLSTFELVFYRSLFGMVSLGLWVLWQKKDLRTHLWFSHIKRSCFGTLGLTIWFYTLAVLPLGTSMTLNYTSPLYMALFASVAAIRMGRSLNFGLLAAIVAGFIGVILALKPELHSGQEFAALIGLSAGFSQRSPTLKSKSSPVWENLNGVSFSISRFLAQSQD